MVKRLARRSITHLVGTVKSARPLSEAKVDITWELKSDSEVGTPRHPEASMQTEHASGWGMKPMRDEETGEIINDLTNARKSQSVALNESERVLSRSIDFSVLKRTKERTQCIAREIYAHPR